MRPPSQHSNPALSAAHLLQQMECRYDPRPDGTLFVPGDLDISGLGLGQLPDFSRVDVAGSFHCRHNQLTSLQGSPRSVGGDFDCTDNALAVLEGAPKTFKCLRSDHGNFASWTEVPEDLRFSAATLAERARAIVTATVLQEPLTPSTPVKLRHKRPE
jgi:hypothetical protein